LDLIFPDDGSGRQDLSMSMMTGQFLNHLSDRVWPEEVAAAAAVGVVDSGLKKASAEDGDRPADKKRILG
jgi:hypothetical protein